MLFPSIHLELHTINVFSNIYENFIFLALSIFKHELRQNIDIYNRCLTISRKSCKNRYCVSRIIKKGYGKKSS